MLDKGNEPCRNPEPSRLCRNTNHRSHRSGKARQISPSDEPAVDQSQMRSHPNNSPASGPCALRLKRIQIHLSFSQSANATVAEAAGQDDSARFETSTTHVCISAQPRLSWREALIRYKIRTQRVFYFHSDTHSYYLSGQKRHSWLLSRI
jgi:hypothetical protein